MANYTTANLEKAKGILEGRFMRSELRYRTPVTFLEIMKNKEIMQPSHNQTRTREDRPTEAVYFTRQARALKSGGRKHDHTGGKGDTAIITPAWETFSDDFSNSLKQADKSLLSAEQEIANELGQVVANFAEGVEELSSDFIFNNRSGVNGYARQGTFNPTNNIFEIAPTEGDRAVQITKTMMDANKYQGRLFNVFCDTVAFDIFEKMYNQGSANSENLSFQFSGMNFVKSIGLDAKAVSLNYNKGFWVVVPDGDIAGMSWIPKQNREGISISPISVYSTFLNPVDGLSYALHSYQKAYDGTSENGYSQDVKTEYEVSIDISIEHAPLSNPNETPIQAVALI